MGLCCIVCICIQAMMGIWGPASSAANPVCTDDYRECYAWAARGECTDNPNFMSHNCLYRHSPLPLIYVVYRGCPMHVYGAYR